MASQFSKRQHRFKHPVKMTFTPESFTTETEFSTAKFALTEIDQFFTTPTCPYIFLRLLSGSGYIIP